MEIFVISIALAMDSVAVSISSGNKYKKMLFLKSTIMALIFGIFQGLMPLIGYFLGINFTKYFINYAHYISFLILLILGIFMLKEAYLNKDEELKDLKIKTLFFLAIATSIDALAVGVAFSLGENINIFKNVFIITVVTFVLSLIAVYIGKTVGIFLKDKAEYLGGIILIILAFKMLLF